MVMRKRAMFEVELEGMHIKGNACHGNQANRSFDLGIIIGVLMTFINSAVMIYLPADQPYRIHNSS